MDIKDMASCTGCSVMVIFHQPAAAVFGRLDVRQTNLAYDPVAVLAARGENYHGYPAICK